MKKPKEKPKYGMWSNAAWMIGIAWREKEKKVLVISILIALFAVAANLVELYAVPSILAAVEARVPFGELLRTIALFVGAMMLCGAASEYLITNSNPGRNSVRQAVTARIVHKSMTTSYPNLFDQTFIKLQSKVGVGGASRAVWESMTFLLQNVLGLVLYLALLTAVNPLLFGVVIVTSFVSYMVMAHAMDYYYERGEQEAEGINRCRYIVNKIIDTTAAKDIRIFGLGSWLAEMHRKALDMNNAFYREGNRGSLRARIIDLILTFLRNGIAYAYLIWMVLAGKLSASEFLLYFSAVSGFAAWVTGILTELFEYKRLSTDLSFIREMLDYPEPFRFDEGEPLKAVKNEKYRLELENVSFRYPEAEKETLKNINFTLHPGEKVAVVGLNGAGKTTLVKIMCGFLDPTEGRVLLNGRDIREYNRRDYYELFSAVFQDFLVLPESIAANVAQATENIDMERVKDCIEKAGLRQKVESEPRGYDTLLNREVYFDAIMLSGGETQRLMLARALYKDVPFVILDEPTAALDPIAESELYNRYHEMTQGKSSVYISHRLASTRFCDRVLLLEDARIAEEGTHEELLARGGRYAELFNVQSRYYQEGGLDDEAEGER